MFKSYVTQSRTEWGRADEAQPTDEQIKIGAIQRIATASELMAKNHAQLIEERDRYKRWYEQESTSRREEQRSRDNTIRALRGVITRMKKAPKPTRKD